MSLLTVAFVVYSIDCDINGEQKAIMAYLKEMS
jgi:hypothetical protein